MGLIDDHPHRSVLRNVARPARYAGPEYGAATRRGCAEVSLVLAFPDVYEVGCSHLGTTILYRLAQRHEWVQVERAFAPWPDYARILGARGLALTSRETHAPLGTFDVVGFTLQHELTYTTILWMLELARIDVRARDRGPDAPLVVAGGPGSTNPEPLSDFIDAFVAGDGEIALDAVLSAVRRGRRRGWTRARVLEELAATGFVYVPRLYDRGPGPSGRRVVTTSRSARAPLPVGMAPPASLDASAAVLPIVPAVQTVFDRHQVEIARGCSGGCRFCHAAVYYAPVRERSPGSIVEQAVSGALSTGHDEVGLAGLSTADYPALVRVVEALGPLLDENRLALSVASLRAYGLPAGALRAIRRVKATGMTLAPEAGGGRLRRVINKDVSDDDLLGALELLEAHGWQKVKLYFMIGLPGEEDRDLERLARLVARACRLWGPRGRRRLSVSVSSFVPKPFTALEREAYAGPERLRARARRVRELLEDSPARLSFHDPEQGLVESLLARGGREMGEVLEAARARGCRLDGWSEWFDPHSWRWALARAGVDPGRESLAIDPRERVPWDVLEAHVDREHLRREAERARVAEITGRCDAPIGRVCHGCGAPCDPGDAALSGGDDTGAGLRAARRRLDERARASCEAFGPADEGIRHMLLLRFDRTGAAAWLSHRDTIRVLGQSLRRAAVPLSTSRGFTPRPRMAFAAALPVGVIGLDERLRVQVRAPLRSERALLTGLASACPDGFRFTAARMVEPAVAREVVCGPDAIRLMLVTRAGTAPETVREAVDALDAAPCLRRSRRAGGTTITIDLAPLIGTLHVCELSSLVELEDAPDPDRMVVVADLGHVEGRWLRPGELVDLLEERGVGVDYAVRRIALEVDP